MKRVIIFVVAILFATTSAYAEDKIVSFDKLPVNAQKLIKKYFAKETVKYVTTDGRSIYREYEVKMKSGFDVEFNSKGKWIKIDCELSEVPKGLVPDEILDYIKINFKGEFVREIELERGSIYKVELSDATDLKFNKKFELIEVDID